MSASITVVIPAYNAEKTIETSVLSVLAQTDQPEEIIVVDDGSKDATSLAIEKFGNRVILLRQENQGAAMARQTGTAAATSDYIAYLDADDWWPENKIERCRELIRFEDIDFMLADLQRAKPGDPPEKYLPRNSSFYPWAIEFFKRTGVSMVQNLYKLEPADGLSLLLRGYPVYPSTMLVKRHVIEVVGGWDAKIRRTEDFDIGLRISRRYPMHCLDEVQAILGIHEVNESAYPYVVMQTEHDIKVLFAHLQAEPFGSEYHRQVEKALGRKYYSLGHSHRQEGQFASSQRCYANALYWPGLKIKSLIFWCLVFIKSFFEHKQN